MKKNLYLPFFSKYGQKKLLIIMKLTLFFMLLCGTAFSTGTFSQNRCLTFDIENASVKDVFRMIEDQSSYRFFYNDELIELKKLVDLYVQELSIEEVLNQLFMASETSYTIMENDLVVVAPKRVLQQQTISGRVTDATTGEALPGVTIQVAGTMTGAISQANGNYTVNIPAGSNTLIFSFVGYLTQEIAISGRTVIDVVMVEMITALEEVVVVGYGTQKKVTVTGAITTLGSDDVKLTPQANLTQGLAGSLSGVIINQRGGEPGRENTEIFIRGRSTTEDSSPLYVIDGIVRDYQGLDRLDPNEVESITVLKDASAAIYGSRAANGVILITTKRGTVGRPTLNLTYNHGFSQPTRLPEVASSGVYAEAYNLTVTMQGQQPRWTEEEVQKFYDGSDPIRYPNTNWYDLCYQDWKHQDKVNLSVNGGTDNVKYFISGGYLNVGSPYEKSFTYNKQYNVRSNIDATINDNITISLDLAGRIDDILGTNIDYAHILLGYPYQLAINPDGSYGEGRTGENAVGMVRERSYEYRDIERGVLTSSLSAVWKLPWVQGLSLSSTFAFDYDKGYNKNGQNVFYYYVYNPDSDTYTKTKGSNAAYPNLSVSWSQGNSVTANARLAFVRSFGSHNVDAFVAYEQNTTHNDNLSASRSQFLSFAIEELFAGTADKTMHSNSGSANNTARQHYFGRIAYDYGLKYLLQFQLRYDGSQNFPPEKRWGLFPGVSAGWVISEESFMDAVPVVSFMKLRGSWGQLGNDRVSSFQYLTTYQYGNNPTFGTSPTEYQGLRQSGVPNPDITWEVATNYNIGIETRLWGQLLGIDVDLFTTRRNNILATRNASVPQYTGLSLPDENFGIVDNKGIELTISHLSRIGDVNYNVRGNFTYVRNEVIDIDEAPMAEDYQLQTGKPIGAQLVYVIDYDYSGGIFNSDEEADAYGATLPGTGAGHLVRKDMNGDGKINTDDRVRQELTTSPQIVFGLNMGATYKGFELMLNWQGQARVYATPLGRFTYNPQSMGNFMAWLWEDGWRPDNVDGSKPRAGLDRTQGYGGTDYTLFNGAFLRLKNAELAYTIPNNISSRIRVDRARIFVSGYNLFSFDYCKPLSVDPEATNTNTNPPERIINLGVSLTF
ncbi:MAG: TonB-dependent receptor [Bacteroidales bacterium]|nr:TonB-dependent receptor [Bacteroidales bacterium]